jgi:FkbM family methyltransferase
MGTVMAEVRSDDLIAVTYQGRTVEFEACGGGIERELKRGRFYEMQMLQYIESLSLAGAYVDVGGGIGTHALFFAAFCSSTVVHTFEPRAKMSTIIQRHVQNNRLSDRIRVHQIGLSSRRETAAVELDGKMEQIPCVPLDEVVTDAVSVMKVDVEGMEAAVFEGAQRILRESKPLIFVEAHSDEELRRDAAVLEPHGYQLTGRVFNSAPTYEFAAASSRMAPTSELPIARSLLKPELWVSDHRDLQVSCSADRLRVRSRLPGETIGQAPIRLKLQPADPLLSVAPGATVFLQAGGSWGKDSNDRSAVLFVMQYDGANRTEVSRPMRHSRLFWRLELRPETTHIRVVLRVQGSGEFELERLALHVAAATGRN